MHFRAFFKVKVKSPNFLFFLGGGGGGGGVNGKCWARAYV